MTPHEFQEIDLSEEKEMIEELTKAIDVIKRAKIKKQVPFLDQKEKALQTLTPEHLELLKKKLKLKVPIKDNRHYNFNGLNISAVDENVKRIFKEKTGHEVKKLVPVGRYLYLPVARMGWHTDAEREGWRIYCVYCEEGQKSFFRYQDYETNEVITRWEKTGWTFRMYKIPPVIENKLWHCVYSETFRIAIGSWLLI